MQRAVAIILDHHDSPADPFHIGHQGLLIFGMVQHETTEDGVEFPVAERDMPAIEKRDGNRGRRRHHDIDADHV
jgi:hypothetical protein